MTRIGNISFYIKNNKICIAEYIDSDSDKIIDCGFFNIDNLGIESKNNNIVCCIHRDGGAKVYNFRADSSDTAQQILTIIYQKVYEYEEENHLKISG